MIIAGPFFVADYRSFIHRELSAGHKAVFKLPSNIKIKISAGRRGLWHPSCVMPISRRDFLARSARALTWPLAYAAFGGLVGCMASPPQILPPIQEASLREIAARNKKFYGVATGPDQIDLPAAAELIAREANLIVPANKLKWRATEPENGVFDFAPYEKLRRFAQDHQMKIRGHNLVWDHSNPQWLNDLLHDDPAQALPLMERHIRTVVAHTSPDVDDWDVVNEAIDEKRPDKFGLRRSIWLGHIGPHYIAEAFKIAHSANPTARLVYNDNSIEGDSEQAVLKRQLVLGLLRRLKDGNVPVDALGIQSHLNFSKALGGKDFLAFLKDVRSLGLDVLVTELDIYEGAKYAGVSDVEKGRRAAQHVKQYLELLQNDGRLRTLITWGISDRYSPIITRHGGTSNMLPFTADFMPNPIWHVLKDNWANV